MYCSLSYSIDKSLVTERSKPLRTEFGIYHGLKRCGRLKIEVEIKRLSRTSSRQQVRALGTALDNGEEFMCVTHGRSLHPTCVCLQQPVSQRILCLYLRQRHPSLGAVSGLQEFKTLFNPRFENTVVKYLNFRGFLHFHLK